MMQNPDKSVLYFSDLPNNTTEDDLKNFLSDYKDKVMRIFVDPSNTMSPLYTSQYQKPVTAKVIFKDNETANTVRIQMNLRKIKGKSIRIMWDERDNQIKYNTRSNLFIKNIPLQTTPREVYDYFIKFGDISSLKINEDDSGMHKGYGYLTYYNIEDAEKAIEGTNNKRIFGDSILSVEHFKRKSERMTYNPYPSNVPQAQPLFLRDFPNDITEEKLKEICSSCGPVVSCPIMTNASNKKYAILQYQNESSISKALSQLPTINIENNNGQKLQVEIYQNPYERRQIFQSQFRENPYRMEQTKGCNLYVKNIPFTATEEDMKKTFSQFGKIRSVKIEKYILETKEKDKLVETQTSKEFGYVCFENPESAASALENLNGKYLLGFEGWKRPLIITYFLTKRERECAEMEPISMSNPNFPMNPMNPMANPPMSMMAPSPNMMRLTPNLMYPSPYGTQRVLDPRKMNMNNIGYPMNPMPRYNNNYYKNNRGGRGYPNNNNYGHNNNNYYNNRGGYNKNNNNMDNYNNNNNNAEINDVKPKEENKKNELSEAAKSFDEKKFKELESDEAKRDYLGELIFKAIEDSPLASQKSMDVNIIGKITGMIIGIPDIDVVVKILMNNDQLENRILEGYELSKQG